jgi:hypothetical protein
MLTWESNLLGNECLRVEMWPRKVGLKPQSNSTSERTARWRILWLVMCIVEKEIRGGAIQND